MRGGWSGVRMRKRRGRGREEVWREGRGAEEEGEEGGVCV